MQIFVTGGTGFIGSHFLEAAMSAGHKIVALRRSHRSLPILTLSSEPLWIQKDLHDLVPEDISGCDAVVHLATGGVSPKECTWEELVQINVVGSAHLISTARAAGVMGFVTAGTCHEYGQTASLYDAIPPNAPLEPLGLYAGSKASSFSIMSSYARVHRMHFFYGRIFYAYGEGQHRRNFWPSLKAAALRGEDFPMTDGAQILDFIPVKNVAYRLLKECEKIGPNSHAVYVDNIGSGSAQTLLAFAMSEWKRLGATGKLIPGAIERRRNESHRCVALCLEPGLNTQT